MTEEKDFNQPEETPQADASSADSSSEEQVTPEASADATPEAAPDAPDATPDASADASAEQADDGGDVAVDVDELADADKVVNEGDMSEEDAEADMLRMLADLPEEERPSAQDIEFGNTSVADAEFQQLQQSPQSEKSQNIDLLMDVDLPVSIELGRTKLSINEILALGPGSVVELNKLAGEPVDLLVNRRPVAKGEVVVVDESFGLRITQLMTAEERLRALAEE